MHLGPGLTVGQNAAAVVGVIGADDGASASKSGSISAADRHAGCRCGRRLFLKRFVAGAVTFAGGCAVGGVSVLSGVVGTVGPFQAAMLAIRWR